MDRLSARVRKLDKALADLPSDSEVMLLSQLDGLIAGVLVCPELPSKRSGGMIPAPADQAGNTRNAA